MSKEPKKVSKKKILFVEIDEEITAIFERIESLPYKDIYLVVPKRAVLLHSVVNLKILKQKLADIKKSMAVITSDVNGMKLAHQAEIKVFDQWNMDLEEKAKNDSSEKKTDSALLKPIAASSNEVDDEPPSRLPRKKSSIFEVVRDLHGKEKGFSLRSYLRDWKKNRLERNHWKAYLTGANRRYLLGMLGASAAVFLFIAYVVLPGATIYIEPASDVVTKAVNIVLEGNPSEPRSLKAYPVEVTSELTISHHASGIVSEGSHASGALTIINVSGQSWPLVEQTRFQTDAGLVFRLQEDVTVPTGTVDAPGEVEVTVVADSLDANGVPIGDRGNIGPHSFFLPGLREDSRDQLYGESYADMSGGESVVTALVLEEDIVAARDKLESELREKALSALRKEVLSEGSAQLLELDLLEDSDVLQYGEALIDMPYEVAGEEMETFEISGSLTLSGVAYDTEALTAILKTELVTAQTPGKQLVRIEENSVSFDVIEVNNTYLYYKLTAQIQGIEEYQIDPELEGGNRLAKKIKEHVAGLTIEEAESYIQNLEEVNQVTVKIWPSWSPNIPSLPDNIRIKSLSDADGIELEAAEETR